MVNAGWASTNDVMTIMMTTVMMMQVVCAWVLMFSIGQGHAWMAYDAIIAITSTTTTTTIIISDFIDSNWMCLTSEHNLIQALDDQCVWSGQRRATKRPTKQRQKASIVGAMRFGAIRHLHWQGWEFSALTICCNLQPITCTCRNVNRSTVQMINSTPLATKLGSFHLTN